MKKLDLIGEKFGYLTVIKEDGHNSSGKIEWKCKCVCGKIIKTTGNNLRSGNSRSCGCKTQELNRNTKKEDLVNKKFGKILVISYNDEESIKNRCSTWNCVCECGKIMVVRTRSLKTKNTTSCGCDRSQGEQIIRKILLEHQIPFEEHYKDKNCLFESGYPAEFDFKIYENESFYYLEFDGEQHNLTKERGFFDNNTIEKIQKRDLIKNKYCLENNIPLIRLPYKLKHQLSLELIGLKNNNYRVMEAK